MQKRILQQSFSWDVPLDGLSRAKIVGYCRQDRASTRIGRSHQSKALACGQAFYEQGGIRAARQLEGEKQFVAAFIEIVSGLFVVHREGRNQGGPVAARKKHLLESLELPLLRLHSFFHQNFQKNLVPGIAAIELESAGGQRQEQISQLLALPVRQSAVHGDIPEAQGN